MEKAISVIKSHHSGVEGRSERISNSYVSVLCYDSHSPLVRGWYGVVLMCFTSKTSHTVLISPKNSLPLSDSMYVSRPCRWNDGTSDSISRPRPQHAFSFLMVETMSTWCKGRRYLTHTYIRQTSLIWGSRYRWILPRMGSVPRSESKGHLVLRCVFWPGDTRCTSLGP